VTAPSDLPQYLRTCTGVIGEMQLSQELGESPRSLEIAIGGTVKPRQVGSYVRVYPSAQQALNVYFDLSEGDADYFTPVTLPAGDTGLSGAAQFLLLTPERLAMLAEAGQGPAPSNVDDVAPDPVTGLPPAYQYRWPWSELASFVERQASMPAGETSRWRAAGDLDHVATFRGYPPTK
jgi:hypothetical protein